MTYLVCASTGYFLDDVAAQCATCHAPIVHRPHAPADATKLCCSCWTFLIASDPRVTVRVTEDTRREIALFNAKTSGTQ